MSEEKSVIKEVLEDVPKDFSKRILWLIFSSVFFIAFTYGVGYKSFVNIFPADSSMIDVYVRVGGNVSPGETLELYPSSLQGTVKLNGEVQWAGNGIPFDIISKKTVELRRISIDQGKKTIDILSTLNVGEKPILAFILKGGQ